MNFRDVMLAYGKLSKDLMSHGHGGNQIGLEFSGKVCSAAAAAASGPPNRDAMAAMRLLFAYLHAGEGDVLLPATGHCIVAKLQRVGCPS